ncbi:MAG: beta-lactamase family protein [Saprospiraceae bacterium]|nr:beta-lactamase family protein [Saprospiraceae bacterium]
MKQRFFCLALWLCLGFTFLAGQTSIKNALGEEVERIDLEEFLSIAMEDFEIPGLSLAIINDGQVVYHTVRGMADREEEVKVDALTIFEGASLSKPLFAHFVMTFVEEGKLDLDRPLYEYLPYEDIADDERYKQITARMVLCHTTGFPNWRTDYPAQKLFIQFEPGSSWHYSGEGYQYLALVLAKLANTDAKGLEALFQERIAVPIGLSHTRFIQDSTNLARKAKPYKEGMKLKSSFTNEAFGAAYGVHTEAQDFSKWLIAVLDEALLKKESYAVLFEDQVRFPADSENAQAGNSHWTLGFSKFNSPFGTFYTHGGNNPGFTSAFGIQRAQKWGVVYFTNANQVSDFGFELFAFLHEQ